MTDFSTAERHPAPASSFSSAFAVTASDEPFLLFLHLADVAILESLGTTFVALEAPCALC
jgi:hypothetical protein